MDGTSIAAEVRRARVAAGLTQAELARRAGTTQSAVSRMESGRVVPSIAGLARVADATGRAITLVIGTRPDAWAPEPHPAPTGPRPAVRPTEARRSGRPLPTAARRRRA